ncbi:MAG: acyl-CoA dehydrogenase family protein [Solirubrobacterales bacterium]
MNEPPNCGFATMGFESTDQKSMIDGLSQLCARHMTEEYLRKCDRDGAYPIEAMDALAEAGWSGLPVPSDAGGAGGSVADLAVVHRTIARFALAPAQAYFSMWTLGADAIARLGDEAQRDRWLPALSRGEARVAFALTEPDSGSDAAALRSRGVVEGDRIKVSGQKVFITGAASSDVIITAVRTRDRQDDSRGISLVMIDPNASGVRLHKLEKIGLRSIDLCEVFLDDVEVGVDDVLGPLHGGWEALREGLALERTLVAAICVGATRQILDLCLEYAQQRVAFGKPIGSFQMVAAKLVRMRTEMDAADLLVARAAAAIDQQRPDAAELAAVAKLHASESYVSATRDGVQVFGGYGFTEEYPVARHYRDAKFMEIGAGTSEIQTTIIARSMGLG